jgi:hypothetical protein
VEQFREAVQTSVAEVKGPEDPVEKKVHLGRKRKIKDLRVKDRREAREIFTHHRKNTMAMIANASSSVEEIDL